MAANGISTLGTKQLKQEAKIAIVQAKRQGKIVAKNGTITGNIDATKRYFRDRNTYNLNLLPTKYVGNASYNNQDQTGSVRSLTSAAITADPITVSGYAIPGSDIVVNVTWPNGLTPAFDIRYGGVEHIRGETYSIPKSVIQTGGTGSLVVTVDQVGMQPGRPWTAEAGSFVFVADWLMITYEFTDGQDLDTRTRIVTPNVGQTSQGNYLGWGVQSQWPTTGTPILKWGGDNTGTGYESVLVDLVRFRTVYPYETQIVIDLRAEWFVTTGVNPVTVAATLYKGGTMTGPTSFTFNNTTYTSTSQVNSVAKVITLNTQSAGTSGERVATLTYNLTSNSGIFNNNDTTTASV